MEISHEDFLMFIDRALDGMLRIVEELGEERANMRSDLPGANSHTNHIKKLYLGGEGSSRQYGGWWKGVGMIKGNPGTP